MISPSGRLFVLLSAAAGLLLLFDISESCNEAVCASIVSKCMITQSCKCDLKNCSCCKECFSCLSHLYSECCSCVDMCPKPNYTASALSSKSHVEDLPGAIPNLFQVLTSEPDAQQRWITVTFPVDYELSHYQPHLEKHIKYKTRIPSETEEVRLGINSAQLETFPVSDGIPEEAGENIEQEVDPVKDMITLNCSVAYLSQCMPWNKCKGSCQSMGAASYRWFHDGCCECIGEHCMNYGINESRCLKCPEQDDALIDEADRDYGEEDDNI